MKACVPALLVALMLAGCTPTRVDERAPLAVPDHWHHAGDTAAADLASWWRGFRDPQLDGLIAQALAANHDLKIAAARWREARALAESAESVLYPGIDLFAGGGRDQRIDRVIPAPTAQGIVLTSPVADSVSGGITARWDLDLFGANRLRAEAAMAQSVGAEEALRMTRVALLSQVADAYLELRGIQRQSEILRQSIQVEQRRLVVVQAFHRAGLSTRLDLDRQDARLRATEAAIPSLNQAAAALIHRLGVLTATAPGYLQSRLSTPAPLPQAGPPIPNRLPGDLLTQRPDLRLALTRLTAAAAELGAARADLLPKFVLSAGGGYGALALGGFPGLAEGIYTLGSGLATPLFHGGRLRAHIAAADARLEQAGADYEKTFLLALEDVENAFVAHQAALARREHLARADAAAKRALEAAYAFQQRGLTDLLAVLDAQRAELEAEDRLAKAETAALTTLAALYRAFGGGWVADGMASRNHAIDAGNKSGLSVAVGR